MNPARLILIPVALIGLALPCPAQTVDDYIALIEGCRAGDLEAVKAGLAKGIHIDQPDGDNWTPLCHALDLGQEEVARYLISKGASVNTRTNDWQYTLNFAIRACSIEIVELLLHKGADPNPLEKNQYGSYRPPMAVAIEMGNMEALKLLEASGVSLQNWKFIDYDALSHAVHHNNAEAVHYLLNKVDVEPNQQNPGGDYPITIASLEAHEEILKALLAAGADPNVISKGKPNINGYSAIPHTALVMAVRKNAINTVRILLEAGADPATLNSQAIKYADLVGNRAIHDTLVAHGGKKQRLYSFTDIEDIQPRWVEDPQSTMETCKVDWGLTSILNRKTPKKNEISAPIKLKVGIIPLHEQMEPVEALLVTQLSQQEETTVVERAEIRKIMKERTLTSLSFSSMEASIRSGQYLGADALILLFDLGDILNARLVSTSTGLVIANLYAKHGIDPMEWADNIATQFTKSSKWLLRSPNEWNLISIPQISASVTTAESLALEEQFGKALGSYLGAQENFFILERHEMNRLALEKSLNSELRHFYKSGWLIDGSFDLDGPASDNISVQLRLRSGEGGSEISIEESGSRKDIQGLLTKLATRVASKISKEDSSPYTATEEADAYFKEAERALRQNCWELAHRAGDAAWALGCRDDRLIQIRIQAILERIRTSRNIIDSKKINNLKGSRKILAYRAPLLLPEVDTRELSAREYIEFSETLLTIYEQLAEKKGEYSDLEVDLLGAYPEVLAGIQAPLELMHSLSDEAVHAESLEAIRLRARNLTLNLIKICRHMNRPRCVMRLTGAFLYYLPYWERDEEKLLKEVDKYIDEALAMQPPYSKHNMFRIMCVTMEPDMNKIAGQANTSWQRVARSLLKHPSIDVQILAHHLLRLDSNSIIDQWHHSRKVTDLIRNAIETDRSMLGVADWVAPAPFFLWDYSRYKRSPRATPRAWYPTFPYPNKEPYPHFGRTYHIHKRSWWRPGSLGLNADVSKGRKAVKCKQYEQLLKNYWEIWLKNFAQTGTNVRPSGRWQYLSTGNFEPWVDWINQGKPKLVEQLDKLPLEKNRMLDWFEEEFNMNELQKMVRPEASSSMIPSFVCDGVLTPFFEYDAPFSKESMKGSLEAAHLFCFFRKIDDEIWLGSQRFGFLRLLPDKSIAETVQIPYDSQFFGEWLDMPNIQYVDKNYIAAWFYRLRGENESHLGVYDRGQASWKFFPLKRLGPPSTSLATYGNGVHSIVVLQEHVYYSYLTNPDPKARNIREDSRTSIGVSRINLQTGEEQLLVSNRRSPPQSPLDNSSVEYFQLSKINDSLLKCGHFVWDENNEEWRKVRNEEKQAGLHKRFIEFGRYKLEEGGIYHENEQVRISVYTKQANGDMKKTTKHLPLILKDWSSIQVPSEWKWLKKYHHDYHPAEDTRARFRTLISDAGAVLYIGPGFYYFPADELTDILNSAFSEMKSPQ